MSDYSLLWKMFHRSICAGKGCRPMPSAGASRHWPCATPASAGCPWAACSPGWPIRSPAGGCALAIALPGRNRRHCRYSGAAGHLAAAWRLRLRLHGAGRRRPRWPCSAPHPRLAVSRPGQAGRGRPPTRPGRRLPERHLAGLRRRPDRRRTRPLRGLDQPGADAPTHDGGWLLWLDYALNALAAFFSSGRPPPEHSLRVAFETCATFDEACRFLATTPVARPVLFLVTGCAPGERVLIERDGDDARLYRDRTVVANAWRDRSDGWRPRVCGEGTPVENNRRRVAAMAACTGSIRRISSGRRLPS